MQTVTLKVEDSTYERLSWLLKHFDKKEIEILEQTHYQSDDEYLKSIKGMEKSITEAANEPIDKYITADKLDW